MDSDGSLADHKAMTTAELIKIQRERYSLRDERGGFLTPEEQAKVEAGYRLFNPKESK